MLAGGLDPMYRAALASSHTPFFTVEILDGSGNVLSTVYPNDPVFIGGSVSATLTSRVSRQCRVTFTESLYPFDPGDLLAPYGNQIRATRGVLYADGTFQAWTVFVGRIQETTLTENGTCTVQAADFSADVIENLFLAPTPSQAGNSVGNEVRRLISDALPTARFAAFDPFPTLVQPLTWQLDRGQALDELAQSVGAFWYALADGQFVLRRYAWTVPQTPVVTYSDGDGGSVTASSATRSRDTVRNSLTVTGERLNGDDAVYATAQDTNPDSPTFYSDQFGRRHALLRLQTPATQASAQGAAFDNLKRLTALVESWNWEMTPDAALELGDAVALDVRGRSDIIQVVASFTIPLDLSGPMTVNGRSLIVGSLEA